MLSPVLVPAGASRFVRALALVVPLAALAAAANPPWTEQQELTASDGAANDNFGRSVSVSADTAVIGASSEINAQGAAYVLVRSGGVWTQQQELTASDGAVDDYFGFSVSVSGDTAVIGAWNKAINSQSGQGAAYVFVRSNGVWTRQQELTAPDGAWEDAFGFSVSVSGDTAVIGAPGKNAGQGATYVFVRSGGAWTQQQELTASDGAAGDWFGYSVSLSGSTAVIGALAKHNYQGAAYVFVLSGGVWGQQQELTATDGVANDYFGVSVSVSGGTAAIGAVGRNNYQGAAYVFGVTQPTISAVISAGAFGGSSAVAPGTWVEIYGSKLSSTTRPWTTADFTGNSAPTSLDGVTVTIGGQAAFIEYISPGQVNAQLPSNIGPGSLQLTVTSGGITSAPVNVTVNPAQPGLLAPPSFKIGADQYVVAQFGDGTYVAPAGSIAGVNSRPAQPGETIVIYGIGFGPVIPDIPAGQIATGTSQLSASLQVLFGQTVAQVSYAGLTQGSVGLYQFNVVVPAVADNNLVSITFNLGNAAGMQTLYTAVHR